MLLMMSNLGCHLPVKHWFNKQVNPYASYRRRSFLLSLILLPMTTSATNAASYALPVFNLNGSSARSIEDEYCAALNAIRIAERLLAAATCHGRDFQMQPSSVYEQARHQRSQMLHHLEEVHNYLESWYWNAVDAQ